MGPARSPLAGPFSFFASAAQGVTVPLEQADQMCSNAGLPFGIRCGRGIGRADAFG
jgi:hypothetical protein